MSRIGTLNCHVYKPSFHFSKALIDVGKQGTYITKKLSHKLGLEEDS